MNLKDIEQDYESFCSFDRKDERVGWLIWRVKELDLALQFLTPGGSEYVNDPERCVSFARETRSSQMSFMRKQKKIITELEHKVKELEIQLFLETKYTNEYQQQIKELEGAIIGWKIVEMTDKKRIKQLEDGIEDIFNNYFIEGKYCNIFIVADALKKLIEKKG